MKLLKKILDIPIHYTLLSVFVLFSLVYLTIKNELSIPFAIGILVVASLFALQFYFGSIVIKSVISTIIIVYSASIYTTIVMSADGNIVEPFLLTIAAATLFLAQTYNKKRMYYGMRSRVFWSALLVFLLASVKMSLIMSGYSFMVTEFIGLNILIVSIALWRLWLHNSAKTSFVEPEIVKIEDKDGFRIIQINTKLNAELKIWANGKVKKKENNAYPYIYNEVLKAKESGLNVVLVNVKKSNNIYDIGEVQTNKANKLKYLYIEAEDGKIPAKALVDFKEEIARG